MSSSESPISEEHLAKLRSRKLELCRKDLENSLFRHGHVIGMYWENIARSIVERATRDAKELNVPLFCLQAADQRHRTRDNALEEKLTHQLLTVPNPHRTGKLQGMLLLHENMVVCLSDVLAPHLGLVKDKAARVVKIDLHHKDEQKLKNLPAGLRHFAPEYMAKGVWVELLKGRNAPMKNGLLRAWADARGAEAADEANADRIFLWSWCMQS